MDSLPPRALVHLHACFSCSSAGRQDTWAACAATQEGHLLAPGLLPPASSKGHHQVGGTRVSPFSSTPVAPECSTGSSPHPRLQSLVRAALHRGKAFMPKVR